MALFNKRIAKSTKQRGLLDESELIELRDALGFEVAALVVPSRHRLQLAGTVGQQAQSDWRASLCALDFPTVVSWHVDAQRSHFGLSVPLATKQQRNAPAHVLADVAGEAEQIRSLIGHDGGMWSQADWCEHLAWMLGTQPEWPAVRERDVQVDTELVHHEDCVEALVMVACGDDPENDVAITALHAWVVRQANARMTVIARPFDVGRGAKQVALVSVVATTPEEATDWVSEVFLALPPVVRLWGRRARGRMAAHWWSSWPLGLWAFDEIKDGDIAAVRKALA